jgi:integrase
MGARPLAEAAAAWREWVTAHPKHAPGTLARYRTVLSAALRHGAAQHGADAPKLPSVKEPRVEPVPALSDEERARLLASYSPNAAKPMLLLAYQGMRSGEVLRLDWRDVDMRRQSIHVRAEAAKSGMGRALPMHPRVAEMLAELWDERGRPQRGIVFLSQRGEPYADQREEGGGNPLARAHETACRRAGVKGFRIHDWRHDWAARMVMAGVDLYSLMRLGGWSSLRMVQRYSSVSAEHLRDAARKIA